MVLNILYSPLFPTSIDIASGGSTIEDIVVAAAAVVDTALFLRRTRDLLLMRYENQDFGFWKCTSLSVL
jgi:hypothetical protein